MQIYEDTRPDQKLTLKCRDGNVYLIEREEMKYSEDILLDTCKILSGKFWGDIILSPENIKTKETLKPKEEGKSSTDSSKSQCIQQEK